jgi:hypothetical protein
MSLTNYTDLTTGLTNWLGHSLFSTQYPDFVTLFEAEANRRLRVRQMEAITILVPSNPTAVSVTGAAASPVNNSAGQPLVRLTVSTTGLTTGTEYNVANVSGTIEANGSWIVTVIDSGHLDLQGSNFVNAFISGGTLTALSGQAALPSDYLAWRRCTWTGSTRNELTWVHPSYFQQAYPTQPADIPKLFTIEAGVLSVMPLNSTPLEFNYYQKIPGLQANTTNWLMTAHPDVYLFGSLAEAENFGVNDERMPMWKARRDDLFDEIIRLNNQTRGPAFIRVFGPTP